LIKWLDKTQFSCAVILKAWFDTLLSEIFNKASLSAMNSDFGESLSGRNQITGLNQNRMLNSRVSKTSMLWFCSVHFSCSIIFCNSDALYKAELYTMVLKNEKKAFLNVNKLEIGLLMNGFPLTLWLNCNNQSKSD
jgi:hypothetical protein